MNNPHLLRSRALRAALGASALVVVTGAASAQSLPGTPAQQRQQALKAISQGKAYDTKAPVYAAGKAPVYEYGYTHDQPLGGTDGVSSGAGRINSVNTAFDRKNNVLSYYANIGPISGSSQKADGFWLAINGGPNPKGHPGEMALFYLDGSSANAPKLTVYAYNGVNGDNSYIDGNGKVSGNQTPDRIASSILDQSFASNLTVRTEADGSRTLGFTINASAINNHVPKYPGPDGRDEWSGAAFGEKIGIWFHPVAGLNTAYKDGYLSSVGYSKQGWLDISDHNTNPVPEPATLAALGLGLAGILRRRAKKA